MTGTARKDKMETQDKSTKSENQNRKDDEINPNETILRPYNSIYSN